VVIWPAIKDGEVAIHDCSKCPSHPNSARVTALSGTFVDSLGHQNLQHHWDIPRPFSHFLFFDPGEQQTKHRIRHSEDVMDSGRSSWTTPLTGSRIPFGFADAINGIIY
jgi:hypothetical protein